MSNFDDLLNQATEEINAEINLEDIDIDTIDAEVVSGKSGTGI